MKRHKLTTAGRVVIFGVIAAILIGGGFFVYKNFGDKMFGDKTEQTKPSSMTPSSSETANSMASSSKPNTNDSSPIINLSLDEWIGWKPIIDANQGLETQPGSIFDNLGLKVNIHIVNDAEASSNALIKGDLNAAGYTTNRTAFLSGKFNSAKLGVVMPVFTNYSNGGDGIIALNDITNITDLVDAKIGVPKFSEAHSMVVWFVNKSDLTADQKQIIIDNLIIMADAEQTGTAFFSGNLDVAATWEPYLSNAEASTNSHILFSTKSSNKLIMDGILFRADFAEKNPEIVSKFIDGIFQAETLYTTEFDSIRKVMPMMAGSSDDDIKSMCATAGLMGYNENKTTLEKDAPSVYKDMCNIWKTVGETVDESIVDSLFDTKYLTALSDKYSSLDTTVKKVEITDAQKESVKNIEALLSKSATVNFVPDTAKFLDNAEADATLKEFVEMAKILDGTIIQIEGNINAKSATDGGQQLSYSRAETVAKYFIANGIDANRIIIVGNGNTKMLSSDTTGDDAYLNRRTDIFFKTIED